MALGGTCVVASAPFSSLPRPRFPLLSLLTFSWVQMEAESWLICAVIPQAPVGRSYGQGHICEPASSSARQPFALTGPTLLPTDHPDFILELPQLCQVDAICLQRFICPRFFPARLRTSPYWPWFDLVPVYSRSHSNRLCRPRLEVHSIC